MITTSTDGATAYHAGTPHGLHPPGFHVGPADQCEDTTCHGQGPRTDPAADLELMAFDLATGSGVVEPGAVNAAIALLAEQRHQHGWTAAADWLRAEYTGPGADVVIRRAADRLAATERSAA